MSQIGLAMKTSETKREKHPIAEFSKSTGKLLRRFTVTEDGSIAPLSAIGITALVGGLALSAEAGTWYSTQRDLQAIADSAAYGSAFHLDPSNSTTRPSVENEARALVSVNGLATTPSNPEVTFPTNKQVRVVVTDQTDRLLSSLFSQEKVTISAEATAEVERETVNACIVAMNELEVGVKVNGQATFDLVGCALTSNTSAAFVDGVDTTNKAIINADCIYVVTTADISDGSNIACEPVQKYKVMSAPIADPYADRGDFDPDAYCASRPDLDLASYPDGTVLLPGCYRNIIQPGGHLTLSPGVYVLFGGLKVAAGTTSVTGLGVTIVAAGAASVDMSSSGISTLTPPTHADALLDPALKQFVGIVIWGDTRAGMGTGAHNFTGGANLILEGIVYAKNGSLKVAGTAGLTSDCLQVVAGTVHIAGQAQMSSGCVDRDFGLAGAGVGPVSVTLID